MDKKSVDGASSPGYGRKKEKSDKKYLRITTRASSKLRCSLWTTHNSQKKKKTGSKVDRLYKQ